MPDTVRVRVAVAVAESGIVVAHAIYEAPYRAYTPEEWAWECIADEMGNVLDTGETFYKHILTKDLPLPKVVEVEAQVEEEE